MKFSSFLIIVLLGVAGYFLYPAIANTLRDRGMLPPLPVVEAEPEPVEAPEPEPVPEPEVVVEEAPPDPGSIEEEIAQRFPYPNIRSLDEITQNWTRIPENAMPGWVETRESVSFDLGGGNTMRLTAGRDVAPIELDADGNLIVAPTPGTDSRGTIEVGQTDLRERVTTRYEEGVARIRARVDENREAERARLSMVEQASPEDFAAAGAAPDESNGANSYIEIMRRSVEAGALPGYSTTQIRDWRFIGFERVDGVGYWTGVAVVPRQTYFGEFDAEFKALMRDNQVVRWVMPDELD